MFDSVLVRPRGARALLTGGVIASMVPLAAAQIPQFTFSGAAKFGSDDEYVGDVDGDGTTDFAIGIPRDPSNGEDAGKIQVRSGATGLVIYFLVGAQKDQYGARIAAAGDLDLDGRPDFLAASLASVGTAVSGYVRAVSGATGGTIRDYLPSAIDLGFGRALAAGSDIDGDAVPDLLIGAFASETVYAYSGASNAKLLKFKPNNIAGVGFGSSVDFCDDADHDQTDDVLIGAPIGGYATIRSSSTNAILRVFEGEPGDDRFGYWVSSTGRIDGDDKRDLVIGAPLSAVNGPASGFAAAYSLLTGQQICRVNGLGGYELGSRVESAGDLDADGRDDLLIGSPYADLALAIDGPTGQTLATFPGDGLSFGYGGVLAGGGDTDHDGLPNPIIASSGNPLSLTLILQVKVFRECAGSFEWIGSGCRAGTGVEPRLDVSGCATYPGFLALRVSGSNQPTPALVLVSAGLAAPGTKLPGGCPLYAALPYPITAILTLAPQTLGSGEKTLFLPMPQGIPTATIVAQAVLPETQGLAATNAVRINFE